MAKYPFTCALVTGASSGIGQEIAVQLAMSGVPLVVVARRGDRLEALAARFKNVEVIVADLSTIDGVGQVEARIVDSSKTPIDLVVNNAGFGSSGLMHEIDLERLSVPKYLREFRATAVQDQFRASTPTNQSRRY